MALYNDRNSQVRLIAASHTLAVAPAAARHVLEQIVQRKEFPQALDAGMLIRGLDDGSFKPK
jgi:hypothetical protein